MQSPVKTPALVLAGTLLVLTLAEALRVFWIMPFPGSQSGETLRWAYGIHKGIPFVRFFFGVAALWALIEVLRYGGRKAKVLALAGAAVFAWIAYQANGPMSADVMFRQPGNLVLAAAAGASLGPSTPVVGVELADAAGRKEARAYPVQLIGYHHQVRDVVAGRHVMVTYCTVCRTGRVFSPVVDGKVENFRLVGMDHWNAMFEDGSTGSWWRQANGQAVAGPRRGSFLAEVPSRQMTWQAWLRLHPDSKVMEPDPEFAARYEGLEGYAEGTSGGRLTGRDAGSWQEKSWVVGVATESGSRAFDWNEVAGKKLLADPDGEVPVILILGADGASFYAYDARPPGSAMPLDLEPTTDPSVFRDRTTGTLWTEQGRALDGPAAGAQLSAVPAYQEFWHSWRTFRPETTARR